MPDPPVVSVVRGEGGCWRNRSSEPLRVRALREPLRPHLIVLYVMGRIWSSKPPCCALITTIAM
jgi:hypothetical protein